MKLYKLMLAGFALAVSAVTFTSCSEDEEMPPITFPHSDWKANTTILDFKKTFWKTDDNYYTEVPTKANGEPYVISGRVIGNDLTGNIYQNITIQDSTAAVCIAVSMKDMNVKYKIGEQVIVNCTGLYAGKYSGLFQLGRDEMYNNTTPQVGKMTEETFVQHTQLNGLPETDSIYAVTMEIGDLNGMATNVDSVIKYQSQLIRLNNVSFKGGGTMLWAERGTSHNTRYLYNQQGKSIAVDNSGMSDFNDQTLPDGHGDIEAILSYFRSNWQLVFVTNADCFNFGGENYAPVAPPVDGDGTADNPYNVGAVMEGASGTNVWVTGYIVGWVEGMTLSDGAHFTTPSSVSSNILLAATPDETAVANCIPIALPNGTAVRTDLNLQNNPGNLGKEVTLRGNLASYFGAKGVKEVNLYVWGAKGDDNATIGGGGGDTPDPGNTVTFKKVTTITSGKQYLLVAAGKMAVPETSKKYGYLQVADVTETNGEIKAAEANAFTFTAVTGGYNIKQSDSRFVYQTGTYNSFNFSDTSTEGDVWTVTAQSDGTFKILNTSVDKFIQYDEKYTSYGSYSDQRGTLPTLYEKVN